MVPLRVHNILDYIDGILLLVSPLLFDFSHIGEADTTFLFLGSAMIIYSLLTKYRYSLAKLIPLRVHMFLDLLAGICIMLAPTIFDYSPLLTTGQEVLHFVLGFGVIGLVFMTNLNQTIEESGVDLKKPDIRGGPDKKASGYD